MLQEILDRQDLLYSSVPLCVACGHVQVQLTEVAPPAQWRCRICRKRFEYEPEDHRGGDQRDGQQVG